MSGMAAMIGLELSFAWLVTAGGGRRGGAGHWGRVGWRQGKQGRRRAVPVGCADQVPREHNESRQGRAAVGGPALEAGAPSRGAGTAGICMLMQLQVAPHTEQPQPPRTRGGVERLVSWHQALAGLALGIELADGKAGQLNRASARRVAVQAGLAVHAAHQAVDDVCSRQSGHSGRSGAGGGGGEPTNQPAGASAAPAWPREHAWRQPQGLGS